MTAAMHELPARSGVISGPPISGYRPEGMFGRLLRRARSKAARQQAAGAGADQTLLVVDLTHAELTSELQHELYRGMFAQEVAGRWGAEPLGYDAIALCEGRGWRDEYVTHFLRFDDHADKSLLLKLIGVVSAIRG